MSKKIELTNEQERKSTGMTGVHLPKMGKDEWLTPPEILGALGPFDLDPCAPVAPPWPTADKMLNIQDDGLSANWDGRVWLNPPYGREAKKWLEKLVEHGDGVALIFARTETDMFFRYVWDYADALLFVRGRLHFHHVDGTRAKNNSGAPSVLIAYGKRNAEALQACSIDGKFVKLK